MSAWAHYRVWLARWTTMDLVIQRNSMYNYCALFGLCSFLYLTWFVFWFWNIFLLINHWSYMKLTQSRQPLHNLFGFNPIIKVWWFSKHLSDECIFHGILDSRVLECDREARKFVQAWFIKKEAQTVGEERGICGLSLSPLARGFSTFSVSSGYGK